MCLPVEAGSSGVQKNNTWHPTEMCGGFRILEGILGSIHPFFVLKMEQWRLQVVPFDFGFLSPSCP